MNSDRRAVELVRDVWVSLDVVGWQCEDGVCVEESV